VTNKSHLVSHLDSGGYVPYSVPHSVNRIECRRCGSTLPNSGKLLSSKSYQLEAAVDLVGAPEPEKAQEKCKPFRI